MWEYFIKINLQNSKIIFQYFITEALKNCTFNFYFLAHVKLIFSSRVQETENISMWVTTYLKCIE